MVLFSVASLANAVLLNHDSERVLVAVCVGYFDASGHPAEKKRRHLTVAGYVAEEASWKRFERKWERMLAREGLTTLHMNRLAQWAKPFDTWNRDETRRIALIQTVVKIIKTSVRKAFSVSVSLDDYDAVNAEYELASLCTPYGLCACQVIKDAQLWMKAKHPTDDTLFVCEKGDMNQADMYRLMKRRRIDTVLEPQLVPKHWKGNDGLMRYVRPFEACDVWAYEDALALPLLGTGKAARKSMQLLSEQIPYSRGGFDAKGLRDICRSLKVPPRSPLP